MAAPDFLQLQQLLHKQYGRPPAEHEYASKWQRLIAALLRTDPRSSAERMAERAGSHAILSALASPVQVAQMSAEELQEWLKPVTKAKDVPAVLKRLAAWWSETWGDDADPEWRRGLEESREMLRSIRGLGPERTDRVLLAALGVPVFPVSRSALRIAYRHGWIDAGASDEEWQDLFVRGCQSHETDLRDFWRLLNAAGAEFCGATPRCDACPLKTCLPDSGPLAPELD